jgi:hypothetical protein
MQLVDSSLLAYHRRSVAGGQVRYCQLASWREGARSLDLSDLLRELAMLRRGQRAGIPFPHQAVVLRWAALRAPEEAPRLIPWRVVKADLRQALQDV